MLDSRSKANQPLEIKLWDSTPPGGVTTGAGPGVVDSTGHLRNVGLPSMDFHGPEKKGKGRMALISCPGGGYTHLSNVKNGNGAVPFFLSKDVVIIVLKYRLAPPSTDVQSDALADAKRAIRLTRHYAREWGIDPQKIGVIGWSAGANLTLNLVSHCDSGTANASDPVERESCRPDFVAMLCPWPGGQEISNYPIAANSPPAFIASARDDKSAPTSFAEAIAATYKAASVPCFFWQIDVGGHSAFSFAATGEGAQWTKNFWRWLAEIGVQAKR